MDLPDELVYERYEVWTCENCGYEERYKCDHKDNINKYFVCPECGEKKFTVSHYVTKYLQCDYCGEVFKSELDHCPNCGLKVEFMKEMED